MWASHTPRNLMPIASKAAPPWLIVGNYVGRAIATCLRTSHASSHVPLTLLAAVIMPSFYPKMHQQYEIRSHSPGTGLRDTCRKL